MLFKIKCTRLRCPAKSIDPVVSSMPRMTIKITALDAKTSQTIHKFRLVVIVYT